MTDLYDDDRSEQLDQLEPQRSAETHPDGVDGSAGD